MARSKKGQITVKLGTDNSRFKKGLGSARRDLQGFQKFSSGLAKKVAVGLGAGVAAVAGVGVVAVKQMEEARSAIGRTTGAVGAELAAQTEAFTAAAKNLADAPKDVAAGFGTLRTLMDGTDAQVGALTEGVFNFARAAGTEATETAKSLGRAFQVFGVDAGAAHSEMDVMTAVAEQYGFSSDKLLKQMQVFGPVLNNLGLDMGDTAALFGRLHAGGVDVTRVMPGINGAMRRLAAKGVKDLRGGLDDGIKAIAAAKDSTEALTIATDLFGAEGAQRMVTAIRNGVLPSLSGLQDELGNTDGRLAQTTEANRTTGERLKILWNRLSVTIGEKLLPILDKVTKWITDNLPKWSEQLGNAWEKAKELGKTVAEKLEPPLRKVVNAISPIVAKIKEFIKSNPTPVFAALGAVIATIAIAALVSGIVGLLAALTGPAGILIAIGLVAGAITWLWTETDILQTTFAAVKGFIMDDLWPVLTGIGETFKWIGQEVIAPVLMPVLNMLKERMQAVWTIFSGFIEFFKAVFTGDWSAAWEAIKQIAGGIIDYVMAIPRMYISILNNVGNDIMTKIWDGVLATAETVFVAWPSKLVEWAGQLIGGLFDVGKEVATMIWDGLVWWLEFYYVTIPKKMVSWAVQLVTGLYDIGKDLAVKVWDGLIWMLEWYYVRLPRKIAGWIGQLVTGLYEIGVQLARNVWDGLSDSVFGFFRSLPGELIRIAKELWAMFKQVGQEIARGIKDGAKDLGSDILGGIPGAGAVAGAGKTVAGWFGFGAAGGIVTRPTPAIIGEAGPEAVIPLHRTPGSSPLPGGMTAGGGGSVTINLYGDVYGDEEALAQVIRDAIDDYERLNGPRLLAS